jgi:hypothetical protein
MFYTQENTIISGDNTGLLERLTLDATDVGVGAVLLQDGKDDIDLPNCYLSFNFVAMKLYFNSSQYYPTLDKTLAIKLSLLLICFIIRLYSCNINPYIVYL